MRLRAILLGLAALALSGSAVAETETYRVTVTPVAPQKGFDKVRISKAAVGAAEIQVWSGGAINPDCSEMVPGLNVRILTPPEHGTARISDGPMYLAFAPGNPRSACNHQKVPGHAAFYAANAGYAGRDKVVLQTSGPEGRVHEITVDVEVR